MLLCCISIYKYKYTLIYILYTIYIIYKYIPYIYVYICIPRFVFVIYYTCVCVCVCVSVCVCIYIYGSRFSLCNLSNNIDGKGRCLVVGACVTYQRRDACMPIRHTDILSNLLTLHMIWFDSMQELSFRTQVNDFKSVRDLILGTNGSVDITTLHRYVTQ